MNEYDFSVRVWTQKRTPYSLKCGVEIVHAKVKRGDITRTASTAIHETDTKDKVFERISEMIRELYDITFIDEDDLAITSEEGVFRMVTDYGPEAY